MHDWSANPTDDNVEPIDVVRNSQINNEEPKDDTRFPKRFMIIGVILVALVALVVFVVPEYFKDKSAPKSRKQNNVIDDDDDDIIEEDVKKEESKAPVKAEPSEKVKDLDDAMDKALAEAEAKQKDA